MYLHSSMAGTRGMALRTWFRRKPVEARYLSPKKNCKPDSAANQFKVVNPKKKYNFFELNKKYIELVFQKLSYLYERYRLCWNEWKINFPIFIFWDVVVLVLIIRSISVNFMYKIFWVQNRIFHRNKTTSEGGGEEVSAYPQLRNTTHILSWEIPRGF